MVPGGMATRSRRRRRIDPDLLMELRYRADITQEQLARLAGISRDTVYRIESGEPGAGTSPRVQYRIAEALGVDVRALLEVA